MLAPFNIAFDPEQTNDLAIVLSNQFKKYKESAQALEQLELTRIQLETELKMRSGLDQKKISSWMNSRHN